MKKKKQAAAKPTCAEHLQALRRKHAALDERIQEMQRSRSCSAHDVTAVKREKLQLKEEIARLSGELKPNQLVSRSEKPQAATGEESGSARGSSQKSSPSHQIDEATMPVRRSEDFHPNTFAEEDEDLEVDEEAAA